MQRIDEKREASGQNAMLEQVRTWQQEQDTEPDKYAVFDTMSADWGGEEDGFILYEIPEEYSRTDGYFPEKMQVYTYCVCKQYGVRYDLVVALIEKESGYKFDKVGDDGHSIGLRDTERFKMHLQRTTTGSREQNSTYGKRESMCMSTIRPL